MPRLPKIKESAFEPDTARSFIAELREIKRKVTETHAAKKLADKQVNALRTRYAREHNFHSPGAEFCLNLIEGGNPESALDWLAGFDVAREVEDLDAKLAAKAGVQSNMFEDHEREVLQNDLGGATA